MSALIAFPEYVRMVYTEAAEVELKPVSLAVRSYRSAPLVLIAVVKNELELLPSLLDHYRQLGVDLFVIIDNNSEDGSIEFLSNQPDVDLYRVDRKFVWQSKQGWINRVVADYGYHRWYIYVDADEHIVFDGDQSYHFADVIALAERRGIRRVRGMLVDMYANGPLLGAPFDPAKPLWKSYPMFDSDGYVEHKFKEIISRKGGPRTRLIRPNRNNFNPEMSKYPLFKISAGEFMANPHHIYPYADNFISPCYLGILHFKFTPNFSRKMNIAIAEKTYWNGSEEYRAYRDLLKLSPELSFCYQGSATFVSARDLIENKIIETLGW